MSYEGVNTTRELWKRRVPLKKAHPDIGSQIEIELVCVEQTIADAINARCQQKEIAQLYRMGLMSSYPTVWECVNRSIVSRWSVSGLERVKQMAWKDLES